MANSARYDIPASPHPFDLGVLLRAAATASGSGAAAEPEERNDAHVPVVMFDEEPQLVEEPPIDVAGYLDGVQALRLLTWRNLRPVQLAYCAAGALRGRTEMIGCEERMFVVASVGDRDWVDELPGGLPVLYTEETSPPEVAKRHLDDVAGVRAHLEDVLTTSIVASGAATFDHPLVVDGDLGALARWHHHRQLCGVIKTHRTRWMPDETVLWDLPEGWRSPRFTIPKGRGVEVERWSCYVRLWENTTGSWSTGLVRIEDTDPDRLLRMCATAFEQRQRPGSPDGRWDRQLELVRAVEEWLAARRPPVMRPR